MHHGRHDARRVSAEDALALHLAGLAKDGKAVPEPSTVEVVMADRDNRAAVTVLILAEGPAPKAVRINATMSDNMLARVDTYAEGRGMTRSGFLAQAALRKMERA